MRARPQRLALAFATWALLAASTALAAPALSGTDTIKQANDKLRTELAAGNKDPAKVTRELRSLLDIPFMAQRALSAPEKPGSPTDHWAKMTAAQRTEVQNTLQAIIEKKYLEQLRGTPAHVIDFKGEEPADSEVIVKTVLHTENNGHPVKNHIDYRLHVEGDHWRIFDVITEDVSTLQNYRAEFSKIIAKDGVDGLISRMKSKLEKGDEEKKDDKKGGK
jgi:phospholipid transport system substrate-binding protein